MNKSVYSLVLMDNVVSEVDKMAYEMGTSRSNLINQILAEYVRYTRRRCACAPSLRKWSA